jgi:hypothetical protein
MGEIRSSTSENAVKANFNRYDPQGEVLVDALATVNDASG